MKQTLGCPVQGTVFITLHSRPQEEAWEEAPRKGCRQGVKLNPSLQGNIPVPIRIIRLWFLGWSNTPKRCFLTLLAARELFFFLNPVFWLDMISAVWNLPSSHQTRLSGKSIIFVGFSSIFPDFSRDSPRTFLFLIGDFPGAQKSQRIGGGRRGAWAPISDLHSNQWSKQDRHFCLRRWKDFRTKQCIASYSCVVFHLPFPLQDFWALQP
jgi:uncharacterized protein YjeT (DUF2065 family)